MKSNFFITTLLVLMSCTAFAQQQSPEDYSPWYRKGNGKLVLNSGEELKGYGNFYILSDHVSFTKEFDDKTKKYQVSDIKSFSINDSSFYSKLTKGAEITLNKKKTFVYLKNGEESKYKMYERKIISTDLSAAGALGLTDRLETDYFIEIPGETEAVYSVTGTKFLPFAKKVSALLADCPTLSKKIENREEGYAQTILPKFSTNLKKMIDNTTAIDPMNVWLKILAEYEGCEKMK